MNELKSYTEYAVSTPTADFVIGFDFNYGDDAVNVTVDDVPATEAGYTVVYLNETTIRLSPSVPSGVVRLQRETDIDQTDHAYRAGAKFIAQTMDENFEQLRHSQQEVRDGFSKLSTDTHEIIEGLDAALELAQDAAQDAQDAALLAQGAADTVNTIIVGGKVGASNVLDASGETQQQVNYNGGSKWHSRVGGYKLNERVVLTNGDIVKNDINGNTHDPNVDITGWLNIGNIGEVESITDLLAIQNPKNGQTVFVKGLQGGTFIYDSTKSGVNDGIVVFNGHVRQLEGFVTPFMAGAKAQTGIDDSAAINTALTYARTNGLKCWGVGKTFECHDLLIDDDLIFVDAKLVCNKFDQDLVSVMSTAISSVPLKNVYMSKIKINGKRELHTGIKATTAAEDGGRHAFRFRRPIDGLYMEHCAGNNSAGDGIEFFPDGAGTELLKNIKIVDCEFNWNRRHGGSGDKAGGIEFVRTKFLNNNLDLPEASGSPDNSLGLFADRNNSNTHQYGAGFDLEEYGASDNSKKMHFIDCTMYGNAYASLTLYRPTGWSNFTGDNDIVISGGAYGAGLNGTISIEVSPFAPFGDGFNKAFKGVHIDNINCMGGAIYTRYSDVSVSRLSNVSEIRVHGQGVLRADKDYLFNNSLSTIYVGSMIAETATMDAALRPYRYTLSGSAFKIPEVAGQTSKLQIQGNSGRVEHLVGGDSLRGYLSMNLNSTWGGTDFGMWNQLEGKGLYFNLHDMFISPSVNAGASLGIADLRFSTAYLTTAPNVSSDSRYKKEIKDISEVEKAVAADLKKNIKTYLLIGGDDLIHIGMIAQEVVEIFERYGLDAHKYKLIHVDKKGMYSIVYEQLSMFMLSVN